MENRVSKIHERALRLLYDDSRNLPFEELLVKGNSVSIQKSLKQNKRLHWKQFQIYYNSLRNHTTLEITTCCKGKKTKPFILVLNVSHLQHLKHGKFFLGHSKMKFACIFKLKIKLWVTDKCPCRLCKKYVRSVGFTIITDFI